MPDPRNAYLLNPKSQQLISYRLVPADTLDYFQFVVIEDRLVFPHDTHRLMTHEEVNDEVELARAQGLILIPKVYTPKR